MRQGSPDRKSSTAIEGDQESIARHLESLAALGVNEVQLVIDPITSSSVEWLAAVLTHLDQPE